MAGYQGVSDEEKLQIAQHFLLSSPPGQLKDVLSDVRNLLSHGVLSESLSAGIARAHNIRGNVLATNNAGEKVIISESSEIDPTHYFDPNTEKTFGVDHMESKIIDSSPGHAPNTDGAAALENHRRELQRQMDEYLSEFFIASTPSLAAVYCAKSQSKTLHIVVSGHKYSLRNYWSSAWTSSWQVCLLSGGTAQMRNGKIDVRAHYFEDGNVQLETSRSFDPCNVSFSSSSDLARAVVAHIKEFENSLQASLESMYLNMTDETFKGMRRVLPVTGTKMEWLPGQHRMVRNLRK